MSTIEASQLLAVDEYLEQELSSEIKHEYIAGKTYEMTGGTNAHNRIEANTHLALGIALKGSSFRACTSNTKIRIADMTGYRFYYPDCSVIGESNPPE